MQVQIDLDYGGVGDLLGSSEVQAMLMQRAEAVAAAARGRGVSTDDGPVEIEVIDAGTERARALVAVNHPAGMTIEAKYRLLGSSLDAGG